MVDQITRQRFLDVKKTSTLRRNQKDFEEIVNAAKGKGISPEQEMRSRGYNNFQMFNQQCPKFSMFCRPTELAELGSGYVLYFHFLLFLGLLLLLLFLLQSPLIAIYPTYNWLAGWKYNNWEHAYSTEDPCECVGRNDGILGLSDAVQTQSLYGTSCAAWDAPDRIGVCGDGEECPIAKPGLWMCQAWCFAPSYCPTPPNDENPSRTNTHYSGLVKSYSACSTDPSTLEACTGDLSANIAFDSVAREGVLQLDRDWAIGSYWITPGNFGPDQAELHWIPSLYLACIILLCLIILITYQRMAITDQKVDQDNLLPNDFAVLVKGLPKTATDERAIADWFEKNALRSREAKVVKVVIGWDVDEFREKRKRIQELQKQLTGMDSSSPEATEIKQEIKSLVEHLKSAAPEVATRLQGSGVAVVVFQHNTDLKSVVKRWNSMWAWLFYRDVGSGLFRCCCGGEPLPKFELGEQAVCKIKVIRAPNPGDINWEELAVPKRERMVMMVKTNLVMLLLIMVTFAITWGIAKAQEEINDEADHTAGSSRFGFQALSVVLGLVVSLMNIILTIVARHLGKLEYHMTHTTEEFSQALKMSIGMIVNTCGVLLFQNARPDEWYMRGGLVENLAPVVLLGTIGPVILPIFQLGYMLNYRGRRRLTDKHIEELNVSLGTLRDMKDPDERDKVKLKVTRQVAAWKRFFEPEVMDQPRRFAIAIQATCISIFFMPVMPWVPLVGVVALTFQYWMDKYMLLRKFRRPAMLTNSSLVMFSVRFLKLVAPTSLALSTYLFLTPSFKDKGGNIAMLNISIITALVFSFVLPLSVWARCLLGCFGEVEKERDTDYYQAQYMWSKEMKYHKDQFLYKMLPEKQNPEHLQPGASAAVRKSDIAENYGVAVAAAAQSGAARKGDDGDRHVMRGGKVLDLEGLGQVGSRTSEVATGTPIHDASSDPKPSSYGVSGGVPVAAEPAPTSYGVAAAHSSSSSRPPPPAAPQPAAVAAAPPRPRISWEFEVSSGHWKPFASDCQSYLEQKFQDYQNKGGRERLNVNTSGIKLSVDYKRMTQMKLDTHKVSSIRRRPDAKE